MLRRHGYAVVCYSNQADAREWCGKPSALAERKPKCRIGCRTYFFVSNRVLSSTSAVSARCGVSLAFLRSAVMVASLHASGSDGGHFHSMA